MSRELVAKIRVGLEEFAIVRQQFEPLIAISSDTTVGVIETSAASAMLHSFYTEIEKTLPDCPRVGPAVAVFGLMAQGSAASDVSSDR